MTEAISRRWWQGIPSTKPTTNDNVVHLNTPRWDDIENEIIEATNEIVRWEAEAHRVETGYRTALDRLTKARQRFAEKGKQLGAVVEFKTHPPELERDDGSPE